MMFFPRITIHFPVQQSSEKFPKSKLNQLQKFSDPFLAFYRSFNYFLISKTQKLTAFEHSKPIKTNFVNSNNEIITIKELADYLKIAEKTAYRFALEKKIPGFKVGKAWRFRVKEIEEWIEKQMYKTNDQQKKN